MLSSIKAARMLGWTSLAVGITEIAATAWVEEQLGVDGHDTLIRTMGVRELAAGVAILSQPGLNRMLAGSLWARVAGDAMDLALLGAGAPRTRNPKGLATISGVVLGVTGLDVVVATLVQGQLFKAKRVSQQARLRVRPTSAGHNGAGLPLPTQSPSSAPSAAG